MKTVERKIEIAWPWKKLHKFKKKKKKEKKKLIQ